MRIIPIIIILSLIGLQLQGQTIAEGIRYSDLSYGSTARALGVGGSFSGLGADFSVTSSNPAGIAEFRKSEFVFSGAFNNSSIGATLQGQKENSNSFPFAVQNIGIVFSYAPIASNWTNTSFAIGLNKIANFNEKFFYRATTTGSIVQRFTERANGRTLDQLDDLEAGLAYDALAIYDDDGDTFYESDFGAFGQSVYKNQTVESSGGINELVVSFAASRNNKFDIGLTLGIPFLSYNEEKTYIEDNREGGVDFFENLEFKETLFTTGVGLNAKFGMLYKLGKLRIGAAFHSPNVFFLTDDFYNDLTYAFTDDNGTQSFLEESPEGNFKYKIRTPWKALVSGSYLINTAGLKGFVTAEVEYIDYTGINFDLTSFDGFSDPAYESEINGTVDRELQSGLNIRVGSEIVLKKFRVRGGVGLISPAYVEANTIGDLSNTLNLGLGYRSNNYYLDLAVESKSRNGVYSPYFLVDSERNQVVDLDKRFNRLVVTFGYKI